MSGATLLDGTRAQARMWGKLARDWIASGDTDDHARRSYAYCANQARKWARYARGG